MSKTISVYSVSLGCPKNLVDTEKMLGQLGNRFQPAQSIHAAKVILINTCSFIQPAVEESIQTILETANQIEDMNPKPLLIVTGCLLARYGRQELRKELPEVDLWLNFNEQLQWKKYLNDSLSQEEKNLVGLSGSFSEQGSEEKRLLRDRILSTAPGFAYLKISEGCDHNCRFCLIPKLKGSYRSRSIEDIENEAQDLVEAGVKEICLIGQDVTAYGRDLGLKDGLERLLTRLVSLSNLKWLRLLYMYPSKINKEFLSFLQNLGPPFLPYFDLPLQHSHLDILKNMGRPLAVDPRRTVDLIRTFFPQASIRTSLIVGYPGESERHFQDLLNFVQEVKFQHLGVFPFYPEEGTLAAEFSGQVDSEIREERRQEILCRQREISAEHLKKYLGEWIEVLVDRPDPEWPTLYQGRAWFQAPESDGLTYLSSENVRPGDLVQAEVLDSMTYDLSALS